MPQTTTSSATTPVAYTTTSSATTPTIAISSATTPTIATTSSATTPVAYTTTSSATTPTIATSSATTPVTHTTTGSTTAPTIATTSSTATTSSSTLLPPSFCSSSPCQHNGTCSGSSCLCVGPQFDGDLCQFGEGADTHKSDVPLRHPIGFLWRLLLHLRTALVATSLRVCSQPNFFSWFCTPIVHPTFFSLDIICRQKAIKAHPRMWVSIGLLADCSKYSPAAWESPSLWTAGKPHYYNDFELVYPCMGLGNRAKLTTTSEVCAIVTTCVFTFSFPQIHPFTTLIKFDETKALANGTMQNTSHKILENTESTDLHSVRQKNLVSIWEWWAKIQTWLLHKNNGSQVKV